MIFYTLVAAETELINYEIRAMYTVRDSRIRSEMS